MTAKIHLPYLTLLIAVALVADSTVADWLRVHWDVALTGLIVIIGGLWVSTTTGVSTTGDASVGGTLGVTGAATLASAANVAGAMQFTGIGSAAAGKIGLSGNRLALLGGSSGHEFFTSAGGSLAIVNAAGNWSLAGRMNSATLQPGFVVTHSVNQSTVSGLLDLAWDTEVQDSAGNFASNTFTVPVTGTYLLTAASWVENTSGSTATYTLLVNVNGAVVYLAGTTTILNAAKETVSGVLSIPLNITDTVTVSISSSNAGFTAQAGVTLTRFSGRLLA